MKTITDTFVAQLENLTPDSGTKSNANFRLNFPNKRLTGYNKITMYCDAFNADMYAVDVDTVLVQARGIYQKNSISSATKGSCITIAQCSRPIYRNLSNAVVEKSDNIEFYGSSTPIEIGGIPTEITINLTKMTTQQEINLDTNANHYHLKLRFVCEYDEN
tara:strand:- start:150 stop:632 length:483 start_codon:yes stop_codon:yes gene_type:complete